MKRLIAEFQEQSFTQIIFPHAKTDWAEYLNEAEENFIQIIKAVAKFQKCLVVCADINYVKSKFSSHKNLFFIKYEGDDTWARDCSVLSVKDNDDIKLLDFTFDGWGKKFNADKDNAMSQNIAKYYDKKVIKIDFILEGGAVESNGDGLILTTSKCMMSRDNFKNTTLITLKKHLGAKEILILNHGYLAGDDTDSHIDTLARFADKKTIMYVKCKDKNDEHYNELKLMENELKVLAKKHRLKLIPLPFAHAKYYNNERLPATYANFLFVNGGVLVPTYGTSRDIEALNIFKETFKDREIVAIDCQALIRQHGSLHCVSMNFYSGVGIIV